MFSIAGGPRWLSNREVLLALWLHLPRHGRVSWLLSAPLGLGSLAVQVRSGVTRLRTPGKRALLCWLWPWGWGWTSFIGGVAWRFILLGYYLL